MERNKLPPVAVTVDLPQVVGHYEEGQEVILTFHAIPEWMEGQLGFALQAMGWQMEKEGVNVVCRVKVTKDLTTFTPAHIRGGAMQDEHQLFTSDDR